MASIKPSRVKVKAPRKSSNRTAASKSGAASRGKPRGTAPTTAPLKPVSQATSVVTTSVVNMLGNSQRTQRKTTSSPPANAAIPSVGQWTSNSARSTTRSAASKWPPGWGATPNTLCSWEMAMIRAAALVKPTTTGPDSRSISKPSRNAPKAIRIRPTSKAKTSE